MSQWWEQYAESRSADFTVGPTGNPYMLRWFVTPRGSDGGIYLHRFLHDDEDRAFHDHPWDSVSILLSGKLRELRPDLPPRIITAGEVVTRKSPYPHRLEVIETGYTLFIMGPRIREWGFLCKEGWRHWTRFVDQTNPGEMSAGCEGYTTEEIERMPLPAYTSAPPQVRAERAPFDFESHLQRQIDFSLKTFGPGARTKGVLDHIRKELAEIEADPDDLKEWVDVIILAFDGAWRAGWKPAEIIAAIAAKQAKNEARVWPDWRTADPEKAIEHDRAYD